ncbi:YhcH/YjgK/YiaL family protein [Mycoplasmopsis cricetuli]|uniref:YhcH/YjgK/YiaL family protein n=1 Tax=Mycoplasmopsis cricetuli TaxID=171283 RepID=UPI000471C711|nr:YhcH/YjgK/YiaL family protein [Mycoplasmopsis cricetuli]
MITDKLSNLDRYKNIHPNLDKTIDWIKNNSLSKIPKGKTHLYGNDVFVINVEMDGFEEKNGLYEIHHIYADLHIVVEPGELIYYAQTEELKDVYKDYDPEIEMKLFNMNVKRNKLSLNSDEFAFFFPYEAHGPKIIEKNRKMNKLIFKIKM